MDLVLQLEDMMDLVLQLNGQLKEMEKELDNLIQLKQASLETAPATVIPIVATTVPSTLASSLAPTTQLAIAIPTSTASTLAQIMIKSLEKELTLKEPLGQAKEQLWANIIDSVNDIWPSIQVIFEQSDLVKEATEAI